MTPGTQRFISLMKHPLKFRVFQLTKLPAAYFAGLRVREASERECVVSVPYKWGTRNPFRSTYFACLSMAAEMSTGALAMAHLYQLKPAVSMLVVKVESEYFKKATGDTLFTCSDGELFATAVSDAIRTGEAKTVVANSTGRNRDGEVIATFRITWSFKARQR